MKKIFYSGILALMALLGLSGISQAQTLTFDPPSGSEVEDGQEITISPSTTDLVVNPEYDVYILYRLYPSREAAEADTYLDGDVATVASSFKSNPLYVTYDEVAPKITQENLVIKARVIDAYSGYEEWKTESVYAVYTIKGEETEEPGSNPTLTFSPASGTEVEDGQEITITCNDCKSLGDPYIVYGLYESESEAQQDDAFTGTGAYYGDDEKLQSAWGSRLTDTYEDEHPIITTNKTVIRARILDLDADDNNGSWVSDDFYAVYTIKGEETEEPGSNPTLTFSPASGEVEENTTFTVTCSDPTYGAGDIWFKTYASLQEAQANAYNDFYYNSGVYTFENPYDNNTITKEKPVAAAAILDEDYNPFVIEYAEYTIKGEESGEREPIEEFSYTVELTPPDGSAVKSGTTCTIKPTYTAGSTDWLNYKMYASKEAAEAEVWPTNKSGISNLLVMASGQTREVTLDYEHRVIKMAVLLEEGTKWSEFTYAEYTILPTLTFNPDEEGAIMHAGDKFTVTCDNSSYTPDKIWFKIYDGYESSVLRGDKAKNDFTAFAQAGFTGDEYEIYNFASGKNVAPNVSVNDYITVAAAIFNQDNEPFIIEAIYYDVYPAIIEKPKAPTFSEPEGEVEKGTEISLSCETEGAEIRYTVDGTEPSWASTLYETPIVINATTTIQALSVNGGQTSDIVSATYTVKGTDPEPVEDPVLVFDPASGTEVEDGTKVMITAQNIEIGEDDFIFIYFGVYPDLATAEADDVFEATDIMDIYDALWLGEEPSLWSTDMDTAVITEGKTVIRARLYNVETEEWLSESFYAQYTLKGGETPVEPADTVATPTFSPIAGEVEKGTKVAISCATDGADIYYTLDGTTPNTNSIPYLAAITIEEAVTIKAIAVKEGMVASKVAESSYTVKEDMANEDAELAGVNIYPNPNDGKFNVAVPVNVTVEVFNTKAQLVFRAELVAGVHSLQLANSGIYFVRFTSENAQTIKRVIVR